MRARYGGRMVVHDSMRDEANVLHARLEGEGNMHAPIYIFIYVYICIYIHIYIPLMLHARLEGEGKNMHAPHAPCSEPIANPEPSHTRVSTPLS